MKKIVTAIIFIYLFSCCYSNNTDLKLIGLKGKVKTCTQKGYFGTNISGKWEKEGDTPLYTIVMHFDNEGFLTEYHLYSDQNNSKILNKKKSEDFFESFFYDENDNITLVQKNKFISKDKLVSEYYDTKNKHLYTDTSYLKNGVIIKDYYEQGSAIINYKYNKELLSETHHISEYAEYTDNYEYKDFDKKNNWSVRIRLTKYTFFDDSGEEFSETEIVEQILEYY